MIEISSLVFVLIILVLILEYLAVLKIKAIQLVTPKATIS